MKHFIDLADLRGPELRGLLDDAHRRKAARKGWPKARPDADRPLGDALLAMIFERPSTRTRVSFDAAMRQLGGQTIVLNSTDLQLGRGETIEDTAKVLSRYVDAIMIRSSDHETVLRLRDTATIPIVNGLTNLSHPCQILADIETYEEHCGSIEGAVVAWCGDGDNNVARSWVHAAVRLGFTLRIACPEAFAPDADLMAWVETEGAPLSSITVTRDAARAVDGADCVVTDTWVSMGDAQAEERLTLLKPYQITQDLMARAAKHAIFLHCLPAYRGKEVTAEVLDGPQSVVFDEAENRIHAQKAILNWCLS
ncbi:MAG: ornithine carbamoyltransferase [Pseudomonadota bacterium]